MSVQIGEKSYFGEKFEVPSYRLLPYNKKKTITGNSESSSFTKLLKSLLTLDFERNKTNLDYVF